MTTIFIMGLFATGGFVALSLFRADDKTTAEADHELEPGTYRLDPSHSELGFRVKHLGISSVTGTFGTFDASITLPGSKLEDLQVEVSIDATSVNTNAPDRDAHLRSGDFFAADRFPTLSFRSSSVTLQADDRFTLHGDLTLRAVTKPVELRGRFLGSAVDPWGGSRIAFSAEGTVNRKDFGLTWNTVLEAGGVLVGDDVKIVLEVQAVKQ